MRRPTLRRTICLSVVILASIAALPTEALSEEERPLPPVPVGTKVRILAPSALSDRMTGMLVEIDKDTLLIVNDDSRLRVQRQAITQMEASIGKRRRTRIGMIVGAGIGALVLSQGIYGGCLSDCGNRWDAEYILAGAGVGALLGAGIGALLKTDRWSSVPLEKVRMSIYPVRGRGVGVLAAASF